MSSAPSFKGSPLSVLNFTRNVLDLAAIFAVILPKIYSEMSSSAVWAKEVLPPCQTNLLTRRQRTLLSVVVDKSSWSGVRHRIPVYVPLSTLFVPSSPRPIRSLPHSPSKRSSQTNPAPMQPVPWNSRDCRMSRTNLADRVHSLEISLQDFDKYANTLKGMYSMRFNGRPADGGASTQTHSGLMRTHASPHHLPHSLTV